MPDNFQAGPPHWPSEPPSSFDRFAKVDLRRPGSERSTIRLVVVVFGTTLVMLLILVVLGLPMWLTSPPFPVAGPPAMPVGRPPALVPAPPPAAKLAEPIVGKWEAMNDKHKGTIEFFEGGEILITITEGNLVLKATYRFLEDDRVEVAVTVPGNDKKMTQKLKISVHEDVLETIDEANMIDKFRRVK